MFPRTKDEHLMTSFNKAAIASNLVLGESGSLEQGCPLWNTSSLEHILNILRGSFCKGLKFFIYRSLFEIVEVYSKPKMIN